MKGSNIDVEGQELQVPELAKSIALFSTILTTPQERLACGPSHVQAPAVAQTLLWEGKLLIILLKRVWDCGKGTVNEILY